MKPQELSDRIAKWLDLPVSDMGYVLDSGNSFRADLNIGPGASSRERVMIRIPNFSVRHVVIDYNIHWCYITNNYITQAAKKPDYGFAFCAAMCQLLDYSK